MKTICSLFALTICFVLLYFSVRVPLLSEPLGFEEGIFAELIVNRPAGPLYSLSGRIDGENVYGHICHPAGSYELLRFGGKIFSSLLDGHSYLDDAFITPRLRLISTIYPLAVWIGLGVIAIRQPGARWAVLIVFAAMLSPLAIKTSTRLQIDNTAGVVFCGTASLFFLLSGRSERKATAIALMFAGAMAASAGKQEWSFTLLAAALITFAAVKARLLKVSNSRSVSTILLAVAGGITAGNLLSFAYDPVNYSGGAEILSRFCNVFTDTHQWQFSKWAGLTKIRLPFILVNFVLQAIFVFFMIIRKNQSLLGWLLFFYGTLLFAGFLISDWGREMRYFAPSLAVLTAAVISNVPRLSGREQWVLIAMLSPVLLSTAIFVFFFSPDRNPDLQKIQNNELTAAPDTIYFLDSGAAWNKPDIDYINSSSGFENSRQAVLERYGKRLVRPEQ